MVNSYMHSKRSIWILNESGFTLVELLVASTIGLSIVGLTLSTVFSYRSLYKKDLARTEVNQNLRGAMDLISSEVRLAGERLSWVFPAVELTNGASGAPDTLILRRNLIDQVLTVCADITAGTSAAVLVAKSSGHSCPYNDMGSIVAKWTELRTTEYPSGVGMAYISSISGTRQGEFFEWDTESDNTVTQEITIPRRTGTWTRSYTANGSHVYVIEQWKFRVQNNKLELLVNNDSPRDVAVGVTDLQVSIYMEDGSVKTSFAGTDNWKNIKTIHVEVTGESTVNGEKISSTIDGDYFPRNALAS